MKKKALITGINGQDGTYLSYFLIKKRYKVYGIEKKTKKKVNREKFIRQIKIIKTDITNFHSLKKIIQKINPNEIYNLAAVSSVGSSFEEPIKTLDVNCRGLLNILEIVKQFNKKIKIYQASSSEMYGNSENYRIDETAKFAPTSPYAISKVAAHYLIKFYREAYNMNCASGILFNHESVLRNENFVTKKIIKQLCEIKNNKRSVMYLGNIYSKRDWGYAPEYVEAMWKMLQLKKMKDFVIGTGKSYTIKQFVNLVCKFLKISPKWRGKGINEICINKKNNKTIIKINKKLYRPTDVNPIVGVSNKAKKYLKWKPKTFANELVEKMCSYELNEKNINS